MSYDRRRRPVNARAAPPVAEPPSHSREFSTRGRGPAQPKQLGLRNNAVWMTDIDKLYYFTDTRAGSSGSPVLSDGWQVIAIHTGYDIVKSMNYLGRGQAILSVLVQQVAGRAHSSTDSRPHGVPRRIG